MFQHTSIKSITHLLCQSNRYPLKEVSSGRQRGASLALAARLWDTNDFRDHPHQARTPFCKPFPTLRHTSPNLLAPSRVPVTEIDVPQAPHDHKSTLQSCVSLMTTERTPEHRVRANVFERMCLKIYLTWNRKGQAADRSYQHEVQVRIENEKHFHFLEIDYCL